MWRGKPELGQEIQGRITHRPRRHELNIIGLSAGYHDSACCLLQDGVLVAAAQEERFTRIKNDKSFPQHAFRYCLEAGGLSIAEVDCIAYYEDPVLKLGRQIWSGIGPASTAETRGMLLRRIGMQQPKREIEDLLGYEGPVEIVDHHLSHAASSFCYSGFEDAAILTVDGVGEWPTTTYGWGRGTQIERFEQVDFPHSLGFFYSCVTGYLGFEVNEGEYKVMGLAPYGEPLYVEKLRALIEVGEGGQFTLNMNYFGFLSEDSMFTSELVHLLKHPARQPEAELTQFHKDVARSVQVVLEEVLLEKVRYLYSKAPSENLCMAGGVALNVVANRRILHEGPFRRLFVQPAAGDAGSSLGAAAVAHTRISGRALPCKRLEHVYLGPAIDAGEAYRSLRDSSAKFRDFRDKEEELLDYAVDQLIAGKVIGWAQGRMEFGPRALGARSILADPRRPDMRDRINALVKMRESFRPFAPAVLESEMAEHFALDHSSPFMLETCPVVSPLSLPSITHVDGSARVQTVNAETNPRFAALLEAFYRRTGCPILLNTSFNMRGEPIVCTALDAILSFVRCKIDVLIVDGCVLERRDVPPLWEFLAEQGLPGKRRTGEAVTHHVYTLI